MTEDEIAKAINPDYPDVYAVTYGPTTLFFKDGSIKAGFFQRTDETEKLRKENIFTFVEFGEHAQGFRATRDKKYITKIKGNDLIRVTYPRLLTAKFGQVFKTNMNRTVSPLFPVRIGGVTVGPGVQFSNGVIFSGINVLDYVNRDIEGYVDNGVFVIKSFLP